MLPSGWSYLEMIKVFLLFSFASVCLFNFLVFVLAVSLGPTEGQKQIHDKHKDDPTSCSRVKRGMTWLLFKNVRNTSLVSPAGDEKFRSLREVQLHKEMLTFPKQWGICKYWYPWLNSSKEPWSSDFFKKLNSEISEFFITELGLPYALWVIASEQREPSPRKRRGSLIPVQMAAHSLAQGGASRISRMCLKQVGLWPVWSLSHFSHFSFLGKSTPSRQFPSFNYKQ